MSTNCRFLYCVFNGGVPIFQFQALIEHQNSQLRDNVRVCTVHVGALWMNNCSFQLFQRAKFFCTVLVLQHQTPEEKVKNGKNFRGEGQRKQRPKNRTLRPLPGANGTNSNVGQRK